MICIQNAVTALVLRADYTVVWPVVAGFEAGLDPGSFPSFNQLIRFSWVMFVVISTVFFSIRADLRALEVPLLALVALMALIAGRLAALVFLWALNASILRGGSRPHR